MIDYKKIYGKSEFIPEIIIISDQNKLDAEYEYRNANRGDIPRRPSIGHLVSIHHVDNAVDHGNDDVFEIVKMLINGKFFAIRCIRNNNFKNTANYIVGTIYSGKTCRLMYRKYHNERLLRSRLNQSSEQIHMLDLKD